MNRSARVSFPAPEPDTAACELTILMPCLDEAETIERCVRTARAWLEDRGIAGEVLVADNGSRDGSPGIAARAGARVVMIEAKGYGSALIGGIEAAQGRYVIMGDADASYDFGALDGFLDKLRGGYELVVGNRFRGGIASGAMPFLHKYLGNPVLSWLGRFFFGAPLGDFHCGLRGFDRAAIRRLSLAAPGMEFASEMIVKAVLRGLRITEVPTTLVPDGRSRPPHLKTWRDGWRHLRFLLVFRPRWLFFYPGAILFALGLGLMLWLLPQARVVAGITLDIHSMLYAGVAMIAGWQAIAFAVLANEYAVAAHLFPADPLIERAGRFWILETGLLLGGALVALGAASLALGIVFWGGEGFGNLEPTHAMRLAIPAATSLTLGVQISFASFFLALLRAPR